MTRAARLIATTGAATLAVSGLVCGLHATQGTGRAGPRLASYKMCELVGTSGTLLGDHGPYGDCPSAPFGLSVNCTITNPSIGTLAGVFAEVCVPD